MTRAAFLLSALALAGCAGENRLPGQDSPLPTAIIDWSDGLSESELIQSAEKQDRHREMLADIDAARHERLIISMGEVSSDVALVGAPGVENRRTGVGVQLRQVPQLGQRVIRRRELADAQSARVGAEALDARRRLHERVRRVYWRAVAAERRLEIGRDRLGTENISTNRGDVSADEVDASRREVAELCTEPMPPGWTLSDRVPSVRPAPELAEAMKAARTHRPDLAALSFAAQEELARGLLARAESRPDFGIRVGYEFESNRAGDDALEVHPHDHGLRVALSVSIPLLNPRDRDIAQAETDRRRFIALHEKLDAAIASDVAVSVERLRFAEEALSRFEKARTLDRARAEQVWAEARIDVETAVGVSLDEITQSR